MDNKVSHQRNPVGCATPSSMMLNPSGACIITAVGPDLRAFASPMRRADGSVPLAGPRQCVRRSCRLVSLRAAGDIHRRTIVAGGRRD